MTARVGSLAYVEEVLRAELRALAPWSCAFRGATAIASDRPGAVEVTILRAWWLTAAQRTRLIYLLNTSHPAGVRGTVTFERPAWVWWLMARVNI